MACFVYILGSHGAGGYRTYVGWTTDLDDRLAETGANLVNTTLADFEMYRPLYTVLRDLV